MLLTKMCPFDGTVQLGRFCNLEDVLSVSKMGSRFLMMIFWRWMAGKSKSKKRCVCVCVRVCACVWWAVGVTESD